MARPRKDGKRERAVLKTLQSGAKGTKKITDKLGDKLVCVRYCEDLKNKLRYRTLEIRVTDKELKELGLVIS